jgi:pimeloyl-ACP methyl ester carboxylesterase
MPFYKNKDNLNLYYEIINGHNENIPIVMLHGFGSSAHFFKEQIPYLREKHKILMFDAEGHGQSERPKKEKLTAGLISSTVEDLSELLYLLNIDDQVGFIGHSLFGGGIAQQFAIEHPKAVRFMILLNSGTMCIDNPIRNVFWNLLPQSVRMNFNDIIRENLETLLDKTLPYIRGALLEDKHYTDFDYERIDGLIEHEIFDMIQNPINPSSINTKINCPTLILGGELDNYAPLWMSKDLASKINGSKYEVVTMTGHFGPAQRPDAYNKTIIDFLNGINLKACK